MIPKSFIQTVEQYVISGLRPGSFTLNVLTNNLMAAALVADSESRANLHEICMWVWEFVPCIAFGSDETVQMWLRNEKYRLEVNRNLKAQKKWPYDQDDMEAHDTRRNKT